MLSIIQTIAERKIQQAMAEGSMADLSHWKNVPLPPDDMDHVPADLRMGYRLLKNSGYIPEEVALQKEITRIEDLLQTCRDEREKVCQLRRLGVLRTKLERRMGRSIQLGEEGPYFNRVLEKLSTPTTAEPTSLLTQVKAQ
jgi:hypothetical protein